MPSLNVMGHTYHKSTMNVIYTVNYIYLSYFII